MTEYGWVVKISNSLLVPFMKIGTREYPMSLIWCKCVPLKIAFFIWSVYFNKILTKDNLLSRGVGIDSSECVLCNRADESIDHLLLHCKFSYSIYHLSESVQFVCLQGLLPGAGGQLLERVASTRSDQ
uniref:Reverse transcriptase zinc-binding domain-containing protein n=1 Tax=Nelumbo nucifera TaxID=4432 RepID=A0A822XIZ8_NELNU|nr:TPA_asm: hypothetical protein HUJ06_020429 [Nelumbo nucifera]